MKTAFAQQNHEFGIGQLQSAAIYIHFDETTAWNVEPLVKTTIETSGLRSTFLNQLIRI